MTSLPITTIDDRPAIVLTDEILQRLNTSAGGEVRAIVTANGIELVADPNVANQLEAARRVMTEDAQALKKLAE